MWFFITLAAFLSHDFWVFIAVATIVSLVAAHGEKNKVALFCFVLFAMSAIKAEVSGMGIINQFFTIHYPRLLSISILFPAFIYLINQKQTVRFGRSAPDKFIVGYLILQFALMLSVNSLTNTLRVAAFYNFIDVFLPYYVASRATRNLTAFRDTLVSFTIAAMVLSAIGAFEFFRGWLLYNPLEKVLNTPWSMGNYLSRDGILRAMGSTGHPIAMGFVVTVAIGFFLYIKPFIPNAHLRTVGMGLLLIGLVAPLSRGPWLGAVATIGIFAATGLSGKQSLLKIALAATAIFLVLLATPAGEKMISYLPFVGSVETSTLDYRERLLEVSIQVILQNPFFGAFNHLYSPAMQELKQGQGIVDLVNTYIAIGLSSGLIGLSLFCGVFISTAAGVLKRVISIRNEENELRILGRSLVATIAGVMIIIFTVSSITIIPYVYWLVLGLGVGYMHVFDSMQSQISSKTSTQFDIKQNTRRSQI